MKSDDDRLPFTAESIQKTARFMASERGQEETPEQWEVIFRGMIDHYREAAQEAGRHDVASWSDAEVWNRICQVARNMSA